MSQDLSGSFKSVKFQYCRVLFTQQMDACQDHIENVTWEHSFPLVELLANKVLKIPALKMISCLPVFCLLVLP